MGSVIMFNFATSRNDNAASLTVAKSCMVMVGAIYSYVASYMRVNSGYSHMHDSHLSN